MEKKTSGKGFMGALKNFAFKNEESDESSSGASQKSDRVNFSSLQEEDNTVITKSPAPSKNDVISNEVNQESSQFFRGLSDVVKVNTKENLGLFQKQFEALSMIPDVKTRLQAALSSAQAASGNKLSPKDLIGEIGVLCDALNSEQKMFDNDEEKKLEELTQKNSQEIESLSGKLESLQKQVAEMQLQIQEAENQKSDKAEKIVLLQKKRISRQKAFGVALNKHLKQLTDLKELINQSIV